MTSDLSAKNSYYGCGLWGAHNIDNTFMPSFMGRIGLCRKDSKVELGLGLGGVTTLSAKASHEFRWNELGLDLSLKGERNKKLLKVTESKNVVLPDNREISLSNQYRPSDVRIGLGAEATYRPNSVVKLGLGAEAGVVIPTTQNNNVKLGIENEAASVSFKHSHLPELYITPKASLEVEVHKDKAGTISLVGDASLYEGLIGVKASF